MDDPYKVLGITSSATDEEVTAAYRKMAKKHHPDLNPGDKEAEKKMQAVNAAYEAIKNQRSGGASYERPDGSYGPQQHNTGGQHTYRGDDPFGGFDFGGFDGFEDLFGSFFGGSWQQQGGSRQGDSPLMRQAKLYIQNRQYREALSILAQSPQKDAEWYYLSAIANAGIGNRVTALNHANEAARLEPDNPSYRQLQDQFNRGSFTYREAGQRQGYNMQGMGRTLIQLLLAQAVCMCCCRPC